MTTIGLVVSLKGGDGANDCTKAKGKAIANNGHRALTGLAQAAIWSRSGAIKEPLLKTPTIISRI